MDIRSTAMVVALGLGFGFSGSIGDFLSRTVSASMSQLEEMTREPVAQVYAGNPVVIKVDYHKQNISLPELVERYQENNKVLPLERTLVIHKFTHTLGAYLNKTLLKQYPVAFGRNPNGDKVREGDKRTPEGEFFVTGKRPKNRYHKAIDLSYPGLEAASKGLESGLITQRQHDAITRAYSRCVKPPQNTELGSYIQIHGGGAYPRVHDWTDGCVAMENEDIEEIYWFVGKGCKSGISQTRVLILSD